MESRKKDKYKIPSVS